MTQCCCHPRVRVLTNADDLCRELDDRGQPELRYVVRTWVSTADLVMMGETHFRAADRHRELGIEPEVVTAELRRAHRFNTAALDMLHTEMPAAIDDLRERLRALEPGDIEPYVEVLTDMTTYELASTGWDMYHVREGKQILDQAIDAGRRGGDAVCDRLVETSRQLTELREHREQHNDAASGVIAAAFAAAAVALMVWAASPGGPGATNPFVLIGFAALLAMAVSFAAGALSALPWTAAA